MTRTDAKPSEKLLTVTYTYIVTMYKVISETVDILILAIEMEFMNKFEKKPRNSRLAEDTESNTLRCKSLPIFYLKTRNMCQRHLKHLL